MYGPALNEASMYILYVYGKHNTNSREINACGGCMFLAPPTPNIQL